MPNISTQSTAKSAKRRGRSVSISKPSDEVTKKGKKSDVTPGTSIEATQGVLATLLPSLTTLMPLSSVAVNGQLKGQNAQGVIQAHKSKVFKDFITLSAISLHIEACSIDQNDGGYDLAATPSKTQASRAQFLLALEREYEEISANYSGKELTHFSTLLHQIAGTLGKEKPRDILGPLFELYVSGVGIKKDEGQIGSAFKAKVVSSKSLTPYITLEEQACGTGRAVMDFAAEMFVRGYNPQKQLLVRAREADRTRALMCYIQMVLWNLPGSIVIGDEADDSHETWYTPAHEKNGLVH
jgi:hypothetical protein